MIYQCKKLAILVLSSILFCATIQCARILGVFFFATPSHYILGNSLMKGLAEAGHNVTMISPYEDKQPPSNGSYRSIVLTEFAENFLEMQKEINFLEYNPVSFINHLGFRQMMLISVAKTINHTNVRALLNSGEKFDAVIVQSLFNDAMSIFGYHFNVPLIWYSSLPPLPRIIDKFANPSPLSYIPYFFRGFSSDMSFMQRVENFLAYFYHLFIDSYITVKEIEILKTYFPNSPDFYDLYYNDSLVLLNTHESLTQPIPLTPNMIEIGGHHVKPPKKLPEDLQEYMDEATEGVIYFSMGSTVQSKKFAPEKRDALVKAFGKLKQKVLWKYEDDILPGQPPNVKTGKWFPQQDILVLLFLVRTSLIPNVLASISAHPNIKLFITHGGLLSTTETVYHGIPILAIPAFYDQYANARNAEIYGYGLSLPYKDPDFSEERVLFLLNELLNNPKYRKIAKERSKIFHDRPLKPLDNAIFWVEYVIRHKGAPHLKVAGVGMPWYKYHLVDVIAFLAAVIVSVLFLLYVGIRCFLGVGKYSNKAQKVKKS